MRFYVDEMPNYEEECPFNKTEWEDRWVNYCKLSDCHCDLHEEEGKCQGLIRMAKENEEDGSWKSE